MRITNENKMQLNKIIKNATTLDTVERERERGIL